MKSFQNDFAEPTSNKPASGGRVSFETGSMLKFDSMSKLNSDTIKRVAELSKLPLDRHEEEIFASQLTKILDYIDLLDKVDTTKTEPTYNVTGLKNILSPDRVMLSLEQGVALFNASDKKAGFFLEKGDNSDE